MASSDDEDFGNEGPNDAIDALLAKTQEVQASSDPHNRRLLDFVRAKFQILRKEKRDLEDRVKDLEHSLEIIQTAQVKLF